MCSISKLVLLFARFTVKKNILTLSFARRYCIISVSVVVVNVCVGVPIVTQTTGYVDLSAYRDSTACDSFNC